MINLPQEEPYYAELIRLGYKPLDYSEKHYVFRKDSHIFKIARSCYNTIDNDDSFHIEKVAHDLLCATGLPVAKIENLYERNIIVPDFAILQEKYYEGQIYYSKDIDEALLSQVWSLIQSATTVTKNTFGFLQADGTTHNSTWQSFLQDVANRAKSDKDILLRGLNKVPVPTVSSFIFTDVNMANFIFFNNKLKVAIDIERPLFGDNQFLYAVIKERNPKLFQVAIKIADINIPLIDYYCTIYKHLFDAM